MRFIYSRLLLMKLRLKLENFRRPPLTRLIDHPTKFVQNLELTITLVSNGSQAVTRHKLLKRMKNSEKECKSWNKNATP